MKREDLKTVNPNIRRIENLIKKEKEYLIKKGYLDAEGAFTEKYNELNRSNLRQDHFIRKCESEIAYLELRLKVELSNIKNMPVDDQKKIFECKDLEELTYKYGKVDFWKEYYTKKFEYAIDKKVFLKKEKKRIKGIYNIEKYPFSFERRNTLKRYMYIGFNAVYSGNNLKKDYFDWVTFGDTYIQDKFPKVLWIPTFHVILKDIATGAAHAYILDFLKNDLKHHKAIAVPILKTEEETKRIEKENRSYNDLDELFENSDIAKGCYNILKEVELINDQYQYIGKLKSAFCVWIREISRCSKISIEHCSNEVYTTLLNKKFKNLAMEASSFRKESPKATKKYSSDFRTLLSQLSSAKK